MGSLQENREWLDKVQARWRRRSPDQEILSGVLQNCFESVANAYTTVLFLIKNSPGYSSGKANSLGCAIIREFELWTRRVNHEKSDLLNQDVRTEALLVGLHFQIMDLLFKAFLLRHEGNEYLVPYVNLLLKPKEYLKAVQCVTSLGLQKHFSIDQIIVPLILQDKINLVEQYCSGDREQQLLLLKQIDDMCDPKFNWVEFILKFSHVEDIREEKLKAKIMYKLGIRLMKLFELPQETCPNISTKRRINAIGFLAFKRYGEGALVDENFDELIEHTVGEDPVLQEYLVNLLVSHRDLPRAVRWARHYKLPPSKMLAQVANALAKGETGEPSNTVEECTCNHTNTYHTLSVPDERVHFVDKRVDFLRAVQIIALIRSEIGIDMEWRPSLGIEPESNVSVLQIATRNYVYLLDVPTLRGELEAADWSRLGAIFMSKDILKLGYGSTSQDLQMLAEAVPDLTPYLYKTARLLDVRALQELLSVQFTPEFFNELKAAHETKKSPSTQKKTEERGLSELVMWCLGRPLDKHEQMSDWDRRPLREKQLHYAALDAFCLLEVYDVLKAAVHAKDPHFDMEDGESVPPSDPKNPTQQDGIRKKIPGNGLKHKPFTKMSSPAHRPSAALRTPREDSSGDEDWDSGTINPYAPQTSSDYNSTTAKEVFPSIKETRLAAASIDCDSVTTSPVQANTKISNATHKPSTALENSRKDSKDNEDWDSGTVSPYTLQTSSGDESTTEKEVCASTKVSCPAATNAKISSPAPEPSTALGTSQKDSSGDEDWESGTISPYNTPTSLDHNSMTENGVIPSLTESSPAAASRDDDSVTSSPVQANTKISSPSDKPSTPLGTSQKDSKDNEDWDSGTVSPYTLQTSSGDESTTEKEVCASTKVSCPTAVSRGSDSVTSSPVQTNAKISSPAPEPSTALGTSQKDSSGDEDWESGTISPYNTPTSLDHNSMTENGVIPSLTESSPAAASRDDDSVTSSPVQTNAKISSPAPEPSTALGTSQKDSSGDEDWESGTISPYNTPTSLDHNSMTENGVIPSLTESSPAAASRDDDSVTSSPVQMSINGQYQS